MGGRSYYGPAGTGSGPPGALYSKGVLDAHDPDHMPDPRTQHGEEVLERPKEDVKEPPLFKVILLNDDYTTMEFVVHVLESIFLKSPAEAFRIMMHVHTQGKGLCGRYPHDIAETKVATVHELAKEHGFPLKADMEEA